MKDLSELLSKEQRDELNRDLAVMAQQRRQTEAALGHIVIRHTPAWPVDSKESD